MTKAYVWIGVSALAVLVGLTSISHGQEERAAHSHDRMIDLSHGNEAAHEEMDRAMEAGESFSVDAPSENFFVWFIGALGWKYALLMPASGLLSFVLTAVLVIAGKGRTTGAALVFIVAMPFMIGLFGMFDGMLASFMVIGRSTAVIKPSVYAQGMSVAISTPLLGLLLMVPSYLLATAGLTIRALKNDPKP
jgi:hypothetical protein